jgi:small subunit ribosomal protein S13
MAEKQADKQAVKEQQKEQKDFHNPKQEAVIKSTNPNFKHIVRVCNVDIPGNKAIRYSLTKIKGLGINLADILCKVSNINRRTLTGDLTTGEIDKLNSLINKIVSQPKDCGIPSWIFNRRKDFETDSDIHLFTGTLTFTKDNDLKRLKKIRTLRGVRHIAGLPVRGQRTKSHFRKNKGKVVGVSKKKVAPGTEEAKKESKK